jgi:ATP phosphoribosyltransferase regulatory subunit
MNIADALRRELEDGISRKDMVRLEGVISQSRLPEPVKELLLAMPHLTGREDVLDKLRNWSHIQAIRKAAEFNGEHFPVFG